MVAVRPDANVEATHLHLRAGRAEVRQWQQRSLRRVDRANDRLAVQFVELVASIQETRWMRVMAHCVVHQALLKLPAEPARPVHLRLSVPSVESR